MNYCLVSVWVLKQASYDKSAGFWLSSAMVIGDCRLFVKAAISAISGQIIAALSSSRSPGAEHRHTISRSPQDGCSEDEDGDQSLKRRLSEGSWRFLNNGEYPY